jgi:exonuclease III
MSLLAVANLVVRYGEIMAVRGIDLTVGKGQIVALLGANGAGKTSSIRMVLGLVAPTAGRIDVLGAPDARSVRERIGFLPEERAYFDRFFGPAGSPVEGVDGSVGPGLGWVDVGRRHAGEVDGPYTWWSQRGKAFDTDTGWRIDYHLATAALADTVTAYSVDRADAYDQRWSDHAPVVVDYQV